MEENKLQLKVHEAKLQEAKVARQTQALQGVTDVAQSIVELRRVMEQKEISLKQIDKDIKQIDALLTVELKRIEESAKKSHEKIAGIREDLSKRNDQITALLSLIVVAEAKDDRDHAAKMRCLDTIDRMIDGLNTVSLGLINC